MKTKINICLELLKGGVRSTIAFSFPDALAVHFVMSPILAFAMAFILPKAIFGLENVEILVFDSSSSESHHGRSLSDFYVKIDNFIPIEKNDRILEEFSFCGRFNVANLKPQFFVDIEDFFNIELLNLYEGYGMLQLGDYSSLLVLSIEGPLLPRQWHHLCLSYDRNQ